MNRFIYTQGKDAYSRGKDITDNPYNTQSTEYQDWRLGWLKAEEIDGA